MIVMSVENPNIFWTQKTLHSAYNNIEGFSDITHNRVSQRESQMKNSVLKVLNSLSKNEKLNTTSIKEITGLWPQSVNRVIKLLVKKNIVNMTQHHDKQNNEKIYSLNKNRAIVYGEHILNYKKNIKLWREVQEKRHKQIKFLKKLPKDFLVWWAYFSPKDSKTGEGSLELIGYLPRKDLIRVAICYNWGYYCHSCFEESEKRKEDAFSNIVNDVGYNIAEYIKKFGYTERQRHRYGVQAGLDIMPIITELEEIDDVTAKCTLCKKEQKISKERPARPEKRFISKEDLEKEGFQVRDLNIILWSLKERGKKIDAKIETNLRSF